MDTVLLLHSLVRFVLLAIALAGILTTLAPLSQDKTDRLGRILSASFVGIYDIQVLLGLLIIVLGGLSQVIHPFLMFIGVVIAHGLQRIAKRSPPQRTRLVLFLLYLIPLVFILLGLASIGRLPY